MKILVLGANGFLGLAIVEHFSSLGHEVHLVSRSSSALVNDGIFHQCSYTDLSSLFITAGPFDSVLHFAAPNQKECLLHPESSCSSLSHITQHLLDLCLLQAKPVRFLFASTFHVYSEGIETILESSPTSCSHPYPLSKLASESIIRTYSQSHSNVLPLIVRLPNVFGNSPLLRHNSSSLLIPDLCRQAICNSCIVLKSSGQQYRSFLPLPNFLHYLTFILTDDLNWLSDSIINFPGFTDQVINVASLIQSFFTKHFGLECNISFHSSVHDFKSTFPFITYSSSYKQIQPPTQDDYFDELYAVFEFYLSRFK